MTTATRQIQFKPSYSIDNDGNNNYQYNNNSPQPYPVATYNNSNSRRFNQSIPAVFRQNSLSKYNHHIQYADHGYVWFDAYESVWLLEGRRYFKTRMIKPPHKSLYEEWIDKHLLPHSGTIEYSNKDRSRPRSTSMSRRSNRSKSRCRHSRRKKSAIRPMKKDRQKHRSKSQSPPRSSSSEFWKEVFDNLPIIRPAVLKCHIEPYQNEEIPTDLKIEKKSYAELLENIYSKVKLKWNLNDSDCALSINNTIIKLHESTKLESILTTNSVNSVIIDIVPLKPIDFTNVDRKESQCIQVEIHYKEKTLSYLLSKDKQTQIRNQHDCQIMKQLIADKFNLNSSDYILIYDGDCEIDFIDEIYNIYEYEENDVVVLDVIENEDETKLKQI